MTGLIGCISGKAHGPPSHPVPFLLSYVERTSNANSLIRLKDENAIEQLGKFREISFHIP